MIRIVTDSGADLPRDVLAELGVTVVGGKIVFGPDEAYEPGSLDADAFYRRMAASDHMPSTRDSNMRDFREAFAAVLAAHPGDPIVSIHVSSALATSASNARQAAGTFPLAEIHTFDTEAVSIAEGLMVREAAIMAHSGATAESILARLRAMREHTEMFFVVDTLEYLAKGGRVGGAARLVGGLLDVKPILTLKDGMVTAHDRHRSRPRALEALRELAASRARGLAGLHVGVTHAACEDDADALAAALKDMLQPDVLIVTDLGPSVGAQTGPGALGVAWFAPPAG